MYIGKTKHKANVYAGKHEAILDPKTWDRVATLLKDNRVHRRRSHTLASGRMLQGILVAIDGRPYTPTHASKGGQKYFYYTILGKQAADTSDIAGRLPASEIETCVASSLSSFLSDPVRLSQHFPGCSLPETKLLVASATHSAALIRDAQPKQQAEIIRKFVHRIVMCDSSFRIETSVGLLRKQLLEARQTVDIDQTTICLDVSFRTERRGSAARMVLTSGEKPDPQPIPSLVRAVTQTRIWYDWIVRGEVSSLKQLAERAGMTRQYASRILRLMTLSPELGDTILRGENAHGLTVVQLTKDLPVAWPKQTLPDQSV